LIPPNLQRILEEATAVEKKHLTIRFAKDRYMINRSGLITTQNVVNEPLKKACDWPLTTMVVTFTGNVVLCCNDYYETEVIGNVRDRSLREVWTSPTFERFRGALSRGDRRVSRLCKDCDYIPNQATLQRIVPN
jgi:radical SAM protein with 4Fe4S-binding SPASM domain